MRSPDFQLWRMKKFLSSSLPFSSVSVWATIGIFALSSVKTQVEVQQDQNIIPGKQAEEATKPQSLSVVLPAYNEEAVIEKTLTSALAGLTSWMDNFELVVVNDGSKDRTGELVKQFAQHEPRVHLINHIENRGYGAALVTGFQAASKKLVFFMDADGQFDIADLERFFPLIAQYDAVLGYRNPRKDPWIRKLNAWGWKQLVRLCFGVRVRDIDCAFKLYRASFFQTLELESSGAMINTEILYKFKRAGFRYAEVGVRHLPRVGGQATGAQPAVILRALHELVTYARKWHSEEHEKSAQFLR